MVLSTPNTKDKSAILFTSAYRVPLISLPGPHTANFQQRILLMEKAKPGDKTDPRAKFIKYLIEFITKTQVECNSIVLGIDANAVINEDFDGLDRIIRECSLCNLLTKIPSPTPPPGM